MRINWSHIFAIAMAIPLLLGVLAACGPVSTPAPTGSPGPTGPGSTIIKIATDLSVSGGADNGAHLAIDQANAKHIIPNMTLQLANDGVKGPSNVAALISDALVTGIVGPSSSNIAQEEMALANQAPLGIISPSNSDPCLTKSGLTVGCTGSNDRIVMLRPTGKVTYFRLTATDDLQGPLMADYLFKTLHLRRAYVMDDGKEYGTSLTTSFAEEWTKLRGIVVGTSHPIESTPSYVKLLTGAASSYPDVIYFGGLYDNGGTRIRKQMQAVPALKNTVFAGGSGIQDSSFATAVGLTGGKTYATVAAPDATKIPAAATFIKDYTAKYGQIGPYSATAFDAMNILIQGIKTALAKGTRTPTNSSDATGANTFRQAVINAIQGISYNGVTGHTTFDKTGDTTNKIFTIYQVAAVGGGKPGWVPRTVITPVSDRH